MRAWRSTRGAIGSSGDAGAGTPAGSLLMADQSTTGGFSGRREPQALVAGGDEGLVRRRYDLKQGGHRSRPRSRPRSSSSTSASSKHSPTRPTRRTATATRRCTERGVAGTCGVPKETPETAPQGAKYRRMPNRPETTTQQPAATRLVNDFRPFPEGKVLPERPPSVRPGPNGCRSRSSRWRERERASDCLPGRGRSGFSGLLVLRPPQRSVIGVSDGRNEGYVSGPNEGAERCFPDVVIGVSDGRNEGYVSGPNEGAERSGGVFRMSVVAPRPAGSPGRRFGRNLDLCSGPLRAEGSGRRLSPRSRASREPLPPSGNRGRPIWAVAQMQAHATGRENDPHRVRAALLSVRRTLHCRRRSARGPGGSPSRSPTPAPDRRWGRSG